MDLVIEGTDHPEHGSHGGSGQTPASGRAAERQIAQRYAQRGQQRRGEQQQGGQCHHGGLAPFWPGTPQRGAAQQGKQQRHQRQPPAPEVPARTASRQAHGHARAATQQAGQQESVAGFQHVLAQHCQHPAGQPALGFFQPLPGQGQALALQPPDACRKYQCHQRIQPGQRPGGCLLADKQEAVRARQLDDQPGQRHAQAGTHQQDQPGLPQQPGAQQHQQCQHRQAGNELTGVQAHALQGQCRKDAGRQHARQQKGITTLLKKQAASTGAQSGQCQRHHEKTQDSTCFGAGARDKKGQRHGQHGQPAAQRRQNNQRSGTLPGGIRPDCCQGLLRRGPPTLRHAVAQGTRQPVCL